MLCCAVMGCVCAAVLMRGLCAVGSEFWKQLCEEHGISGDGTLQEYASHVRQHCTRMYNCPYFCSLCPGLEEVFVSCTRLQC